MAAKEKTERILQAARAVFLAKGFAAARVDDVAARAGVAKGTIYLHFASKEALFEALVMSTVTPPIGRIEALVRDESLSSGELLRRALGVVAEEILKTERRFVLRLVLTEGHNFPAVAAFYHEHVVSRAIGLIRRIAERGVERGEFAGDALVRFPHLFAAPMLLAVMWEGLFGVRDPLDVEGLMRAHLELLLGGLEPRS